MRRLLTLVVALGFMGVSLTSSRQGRVVGQHDGHTPGKAAATLDLAVDGASNAAAIPDDRAREHFLRALAAASPKLRYNILRDVLEKPDQLAVMNVLDTFGTELANVARQRTAQMGNDTQRRLAEIRAFQNLGTRIEGALSFDGRMKLNSHVRTHVKSRIKIYRGSTTSQEPPQ